MTTRLIKDAVAFGYRNTDGQIEARSFHCLADCHDPFYEHVKNGTLQTEELTDVAEPGAQFFYSATQFAIDRSQYHNKKIAVEQGLGCIIPKDGKFIFLQQVIHSLHEVTPEGNFVRTRSPGSPPFYFDNKDFFTIYAHTPEHYLQTLMTDHSVLCSVNPYEPSPVQLPPDSILARVGNSRIRAVSFTELKAILEGID